jgi:hypothetical protein
MLIWNLTPYTAYLVLYGSTEQNYNRTGNRFFGDLEKFKYFGEKTLKRSFDVEHAYTCLGTESLLSSCSFCKKLGNKTDLIRTKNYLFV